MEIFYNLAIVCFILMVLVMLVHLSIIVYNVFTEKNIWNEKDWTRISLCVFLILLWMSCLFVLIGLLFR